MSALNRALAGLLAGLFVAVFALACSSRGGGGQVPFTGSDSNKICQPDGSCTYPGWDCEPGQKYACEGPGECAGGGICKEDRMTLGPCACLDSGDASVEPDADVSIPDAQVSIPDAQVPDPTSDFCANPNDSAAVNSATFATAKQTCGLLFAGDPAGEAQCLTSVGGISSACGSCFTARSTCVQQKCQLWCLVGIIDPELCWSCECGMIAGSGDCEAEFDDCTGLPTNYCAAPPN
jgi:hypothetical protein